MKVIPCPQCGAEVVKCDNMMLLDYPAVEYDEIYAPWTLIQLGSMILPSVGNPPPSGLGHSLHEHQPD